MLTRAAHWQLRHNLPRKGATDIQYLTLADLPAPVLVTSGLDKMDWISKCKYSFVVLPFQNAHFPLFRFDLKIAKFLLFFSGGKMRQLSAGTGTAPECSPTQSRSVTENKKHTLYWKLHPKWLCNIASVKFNTSLYGKNWKMRRFSAGTGSTSECAPTPDPSLRINKQTNTKPTKYNRPKQI